MLCLTRKKDEWIDINGGFDAGGVSLVVMEIRGDKVRLGVNASKTVEVHRREVRLAIEKESAE